MTAVPEDSELRESLAGEPMETLRRRYLSRCPGAHNTTDLLERDRLIRAIEIAEYSETHPRTTGATVTVSPHDHRHPL